ncbi:hypothetical protein E0I00_29120 [Pseudomonas syringae pv. actinidiae]|nr:hypothetical protein [Pseudomonas syringae pv. actinidiae]
MMRTALTGLFLSAALLASPVFAADDLCGPRCQDSCSPLRFFLKKHDRGRKETDRAVLFA